MIGIYWILHKLPVWLVVVILFAATLGTVNEMRDQLEGLPYQVARSALYGDAGILIGVLIAQTIIQREGAAAIPQVFSSGLVQIAILAACIMLGVLISVLTLKSRSGQAADIYHDVAVAPLILFLAIACLPVIIRKGKWREWLAVIMIAGFYITMVYADIKGERMNQRQWLQNHGVTFLKR